MKIGLLVLYSYMSVTTIECAAVEAPLDVITLDDITPAERDHLEHLEKESALRPKRHHGLLTALGETIKSKISMLAHSSASASAGKISKLSGGSSGHGHHQYDHHYHDVPDAYDEKAFDFWALKKQVLNTLMQAAKAIKGGIIALKGQLIKGSGYLVSAKGKLISASGQAITNKGKEIAASALLSPYPDHHGHSSAYSAPGPAYETHVEYGPAPSHHEHSAPSGPADDYEAPGHHKPSSGIYKYGESLAGPHAGLLILKKIPYKDVRIPKFKPLPPSPTYPNPVTSLFAASGYPKKPIPTGFSPYDDAWPSYSTKELTEVKPTDHLPPPKPETTKTPNATGNNNDIFDAINKDQEQVLDALGNYPPQFQLPLADPNAFLINPSSGLLPLDQKNFLYNLDPRGANNEFSLNIFMAKPGSFGFDKFRPPPPTLLDSFPTDNIPDASNGKRTAPGRGYEVVESVSYRLGPNGPMKL